MLVINQSPFKTKNTIVELIIRGVDKDQVDVYGKTAYDWFKSIHLGSSIDSLIFEIDKILS